MGSASDRPRFIYRWAIVGFPYTLGTEGQARALALPGQGVFRIRRDSQDADGFEFVLGTDPPPDTTPARE